MKKMFFLSAILLCSIAVCLAAASATLSGQWHGTLKVDDGTEYPLHYTFQVDGNNLTGTAKGPNGDLTITDGEVHGHDFTFMVQLGKMNLLHSGKFYPDSVSLNIAAGESSAHATLMRGEK